MRPTRAPSISIRSVLVLVLGILLATAQAHGGSSGSSQHGDAESMDMGMNTDMDKPQDEYPPTYFAHAPHAGLMYAHIGLMVVAWVFVLPVGKFEPSPVLSGLFPISPAV